MNPFSDGVRYPFFPSAPIVPKLLRRGYLSLLGGPFVALSHCHQICYFMLGFVLSFSKLWPAIYDPIPKQNHPQPPYEYRGP